MLQKLLKVAKDDQKLPKCCQLLPKKESYKKFPKSSKSVKISWKLPKTYVCIYINRCVYVCMHSYIHFGQFSPSPEKSMKDLWVIVWPGSTGGLTYKGEKIKVKILTGSLSNPRFLQCFCPSSSGRPPPPGLRVLQWGYRWQNLKNHLLAIKFARSAIQCSS